MYYSETVNVRRINTTRKSFDPLRYHFTPTKREIDSLDYINKAGMNICRIHRALSMTPTINDLFILFKMSYRHSSNYFLLVHYGSLFLPRNVTP